MPRLLALAALLMLAACASTPDPRPLRILYLSQSVGFTHETVRRPEGGGLAPSEIALGEMARDAGFTMAFTQDARDLTPERLAQADVLVVSTTGALPIEREAWNALLARVETGRLGVVGIHSAADTQLDFGGGREAWTRFLGGQFDGHPWIQGTPIRLANLEPGHPLAAMWPDGTGFAEEIYQYSGFDPGSVRVLQTLDMSAGPLRRPYPVPVTWLKTIGQGRLFYTNLGHTPSTWDDPRFRDQIVAAIRWAGGRLDAPAAPNPAVQDRAALDAFAAAEGLTDWNQTYLAAAETIRRLQDVHPDKEGGSTTLYDATRTAVEAALLAGGS